MSLSMITDRTAADVENARILRRTVLQAGQTLTDVQKAAFERGSATNEMLNRIESAQKTVADLLNDYSYYVKIVNKTDWQRNDIIQQADKRILSNLQKLKAAFYAYASTPSVPSYLYGYSEANAAEKILVDIESLIYKMEASFIYSSNDIYSGGI